MPELGTVSQGKTLEEAVANVKEATGLYLEEQEEPPALAPAILTTFSIDTANAEAAKSLGQARHCRTGNVRALRGCARAAAMSSWPDRSPDAGRVVCVVPVHDEIAVTVLQFRYIERRVQYQYCHDPNHQI